MNTKIKIKIKAASSIIETINLPNSSNSIEIAHSSYVDFVERLSKTAKEQLVFELDKIVSNAENYNKDFEIICRLELNKQ